MNKSSFRRIRNPILTLYFWKLCKYFQLVSLNSEMSYFRRIQSHGLDLIFQTKPASVHIGLKQLLSNSFLFVLESQMCIPHFRHLFPVSSQKRSLITDITKCRLLVRNGLNDFSYKILVQKCLEHFLRAVLPEWNISRRLVLKNTIDDVDATCKCCSKPHGLKWKHLLKGNLSCGRQT